MSQLLHAWGTQRRVIGALIMREIQLRWGRRNLGFVWLFAEPLIFAIPVLLMWQTIRGSGEHGMPLMPFLWSGYLPLLMFRHVTGHALYTIRSNAAMLYHRLVTPFDILVSRLLLEVIGNFAAIAGTYFIFYAFGELPVPYDFPLMALGMLYMAWWSFAIAFLVAVWSEQTELIHHIWLPISYMYMPISGFIYLAMWLPPGVRDFALTVLPSLHAYEMIRGGLFGGQIQVFYDVPYVSFYLACLTLFGLWLLRDVRQHLDFD